MKSISHNIIAFMHSLKSLPIANESQQHLDGKSSDTNNKDLNFELVENAANWLRRVLDLSIFGFDVVVSKILPLLCLYIVHLIFFFLSTLWERVGLFMFFLNGDKSLY